MPDQSAADKARDLDRIGREAAQSTGNELRHEAENWGILVEQPRDAARLKDEKVDEEFEDARRRRELYGDAPPPNTHVSRGAKSAPEDRPVPTKEVLDALKRPTRLMLLGAAGLGLALIGLAFTCGRTEQNFVGTLPLATVSPTPVPATPSPTLTPAPTPAPTPATVEIGGFKISYAGPFEVAAGGTLNVRLQVVDGQGRPAQGTVFATLGEPPSSSQASHGNDVLDAQGQADIPLAVRWPAGTMTTLYTSWENMVRRLTTINVR